MRKAGNSVVHRGQPGTWKQQHWQGEDKEGSFQSYSKPGRILTRRLTMESAIVAAAASGTSLEFGISFVATKNTAGAKSELISCARYISSTRFCFVITSSQFRRHRRQAPGQSQMTGAMLNKLLIKSSSLAETSRTQPEVDHTLAHGGDAISDNSVQNQHTLSY